MKTEFLVVMMFVATLMQCGGKKVVADTQNEGVVEDERVMGHGTGKVTQGSWLELFMGMDAEFVPTVDGDSTYRYTCSLPELEGDEGIARQELEATWYNNDDDPCRYRCTWGLYVDKDFPSDMVFRRVEIGIDTLLTQSFCYNEELNDVKQTFARRKGYVPRKTQDILDRAKSLFEQFTRKKQPTKPEAEYRDYPEARVCIVAHKIYDRDEWATYIIEFSFDYNGSNGCPSWADYITVNKKTGQSLTTDDIVKRYGAGQVSKNLRDAFVKAKDERNATLDVQNYSGAELIDAADGCAIIDEGVMFYYRPYNIGCGAEGEFNLVLDLK